MIPATKLTLNLPSEPGKFRLGDLKLFEKGGFTVAGFEAFMLRYGNWTVEELDNLEADEVTEVFQTIAARMEETAVPKGSKPRSGRGRGTKTEPTPASPAGPE